MLPGTERIFDPGLADYPSDKKKLTHKKKTDVNRKPTCCGQVRRSRVSRVSLSQGLGQDYGVCTIMYHGIGRWARLDQLNIKIHC